MPRSLPRIAGSRQLLPPRRAGRRSSGRTPTMLRGQADASGQGKRWGGGGWDGRGRGGNFFAHKLLFLIKNYLRLRLAGATKPGGAAKPRGLAGARGGWLPGGPGRGGSPRHGAGRGQRRSGGQGDPRPAPALGYDPPPSPFPPPPAEPFPSPLPRLDPSSILSSPGEAEAARRAETAALGRRRSRFPAAELRKPSEGPQQR